MTQAETVSSSRAGVRFMGVLCRSALSVETIKDGARVTESFSFFAIGRGPVSYTVQDACFDQRT